MSPVTEWLKGRHARLFVQIAIENQISIDYRDHAVQRHSRAYAGRAMPWLSTWRYILRR
jgi:hypothetical protein